LGHLLLGYYGLWDEGIISVVSVVDIVVIIVVIIVLNVVISSNPQQQFPLLHEWE